MVSGKPFSKREIAFIKQNLHEKYPSVIARHLGQHYADDNGGFRSSKAVASVMAKLRQQKPKPNTPPL